MKRKLFTVWCSAKTDLSETDKQVPGQLHTIDYVVHMSCLRYLAAIPSN